MSKAQHTPGPWSTPKPFGGMIVYTNDGQVAILAEDKHIAFVSCHAKFKRGDGYKAECAERDANARLIAAAPELLAALEHTIGVMAEADADGEFTIAQAQSIIFKARAAIAKAKGE